MITTNISNTLAVAMALLLGRAAVVSTIRARRIERLKAWREKAERWITHLAWSDKSERVYSIDESMVRGAYLVVMDLLAPGSVGTRVLVKEFPFGDDKEFALLEATELLEHLKENS